MKKIEVGDRVKYTGAFYDFLKGKTGTVRNFDTVCNTFIFAIEFDEASNKLHMSALKLQSRRMSHEMSRQTTALQHFRKPLIP